MGTIPDISSVEGSAAPCRSALILTIITHIYAAIWVKSSIQAMTRGTVSEGWARFHHPLWWRQIRGK